MCQYGFIGGLFLRSTRYVCLLIGKEAKGSDYAKTIDG